MRNVMMTNQAVREYTLQHGCNTYIYIFKPDHRDRTECKSQWTIDEDKEFNIFIYSLDDNYLDTNLLVGWGLYIVNGKPEVIGKDCSNDDVSCAWIAKFTGSVNYWHGYPTMARHANDIPPRSTLYRWRSSGFITKAVCSKIMKGMDYAI
jgi:hypothetical protein